jgi:hypothetical protein
LIDYDASKAKLDYEKRTAFVRFVIDLEQDIPSSNNLEYLRRSFEEFSDFKMPKKEVVHQDCFMMKNNYLQEIKADLEKAENVSLSLYLWRCEADSKLEDNPRKDHGQTSLYLCTIVHYFDTNWNMKSRFLNIKFIETSSNELENSNQQIESHVEKLMNEYNIKIKVRPI